MSVLPGSLGRFSLIALGAAGVVGSSWLYTNGAFFGRYGAGGVLIGLVIALGLAACVALAYGELASTFPRAGGEVVYAYLGFNRLVGFAAGWLMLGAYVSSLAFYVTAVGELLARVIPELRSLPLYEIAGVSVHLPSLVIGVLLAVGCYAVNVRGGQLGGRTQLVLFCGMLALGVVLVIVGFGTGTWHNAWPLFAADAEPVGATLRFVIPAMTWLTGFGLVAVLAEDAGLPGRSLGKVVVGAVLVAGGFYLAVLLATVWVEPWSHTAVASSQGTITAFTQAGFPLLGWFAYAIGILGLLTSLLGLFLASSRLVLAMARSRLLPGWLSALHPRYRTPARALLFTLVVTLALGWLGKAALTWFLDAGGVLIGLAWALGALSLYPIRRRYPDLPRPYRVRWSFLPAFGALGGLGVIVAGLLPGTPLSLEWPAEYLILAAWLLLGMVLYISHGAADRNHGGLDALLGGAVSDRLSEQRR